MKDENDQVTHNAFITFERAERESMIADCLATGGHYRALPTPSSLVVSGRRHNGTKTPDSVRGLWSTPRDVISYLVEKYGEYDLDAAASNENKVCEKFYDEKTDCLKRWWGKGKHVWLNPPFSHPLPFVMKAAEQMAHGNQIDILLPADNSTAWFRAAQQHAAEIIWIVGDIETETVDGDLKLIASRSGRLAFLSGETGKPVDNSNKGSVIFIMRTLKDGESQVTHYVPISEVCKSVKSKRMVKCK